MVDIVKKGSRVDCPRAFLNLEQSPRLVNENYLSDNNLYPLQLKTVEFVRNISAGVSALGLVFMLGLLALLRRRG